MIATRSQKRRVIVACDPVSTIMTDVAAEVPEDMTLDTLRSVFLETRAEVLPVVDRARLLVGLVILRDLAEDLAEIDGATEPPDTRRAQWVPFGSHVESIPHRARDIAQPVGTIVHEYTSIRRAARIMVAEHVSHLPVIDRAGQLAGIVSALDVLQRVVPLGEGAFA